MNFKFKSGCQKHYDILHHKKRLEDIKKGKFGKGLTKSFINNLKKQSQLALKSPSKCYNSVDLKDEKYLRELDRFERKEFEKYG